MNLLYCGGKFHFDYLREGYTDMVVEDYRAIILGDAHMMLKASDGIPVCECLTYVGPFYFESDGMVDYDIVESEKCQIEKCTVAIFLLEDGICPGTISEIIYASTLNKRIVIYYIIDETETESNLHSACWYPIILSQKINGNNTEVIPCANIDEAKMKIKRQVREWS